MSERLRNATLGQLPVGIERPAYDRAAIQTGVVHLGIGAFHRAHQALYFDRALAAGDLRWGVTGVSLRSGAVRDQLQPQQGLYSLLVRDGERVAIRVIGAVRDVLVATEDPAQLVALLGQPHVHLVTLTITEKGYKQDAASGELLTEDVELAADIGDLKTPRTALGFLVAGLALRRGAGLRPFTVLSCDNLPRNGDRLRAGVLALARRHDLLLADWIAQVGAFPNTMVDRIVPAPTEADRTRQAARLGLEDRAAVSTEPFCQWVIERRFAGPVPDFAALGVQITDDVAPWEHAKLRLLNGAHSAMAYLGGLAGIEFVHEVVSLPEGTSLVEALWNESVTTLVPAPTMDLGQYRRELLTRFRNSALRHRLRQIAMDGSQKIPQRLLAPLRDRRSAGQSATLLTLAVAAWIRWQQGADDRGQPFIVEDPLSAELASCLRGCRDAQARVTALLNCSSIFPEALRQDQAWHRQLIEQLDMLERLGALAAVSAALAMQSQAS